LKYGWEKAQRVFDDPAWPDLLQEHYAEMGGLRPDPDYERVLWLEREKLYRVWTARQDKQLVGYIGWHFFAPMHYRYLYEAYDDLMLLSAAHRKGLNGYNLIARCLPELQHLGVKRVVMQNTVAWDRARAARGLPTMDILFKRLGFEHTDRLWGKDFA
jgi:GNAT superfamily N-acetyltransferase